MTRPAETPSRIINRLPDGAAVIYLEGFYDRRTPRPRSRMDDRRAAIRWWHYNVARDWDSEGDGQHNRAGRRGVLREQAEAPIGQMSLDFA
jgi:hypothetical protein